MNRWTDASSEPVLAVDGLTVEFLTDAGWATVVDDVSFVVQPGEIVGIVGESGSGKSVTSRAIMGVIPNPPGRVAAGTVRLGDQDLTAMSRRQLEDVRGNEISTVLQEPMTSLNPGFTVGAQVAETLRRHRPVSRRAARVAAIEALGRVGIPNPASRARSYPHELSGGMRQRVAIAMALVCEPRLLIADEPTTALDVTVQSQILDLLRSLRAETGMGVLFITHDLGVVADLCDRVIVMYAGQVVEKAAAPDLFRRPSHPYTEALLHSLPTITDGRGPLWSIPGQPPFAGSVPTGCRFHPRCWYADKRCQTSPTDLLEVQMSQHSRCLRIDELSLQPSRAAQ